jgi:hypothetical protein
VLQSSVKSLEVALHFAFRTDSSRTGKLAS